MANELKITARAEYTKGSVSVDTSTQTKLIDVSGTNVLTHVQNIGTSAEAITLGDVSGGYMMALNLDDSNYVEIATSDPGVSGEYMIRLKAGEFCMFRLGSDASAPFALANTAACDVQFWIWDD